MTTEGRKTRIARLRSMGERLRRRRRGVVGTAELVVADAERRARWLAIRNSRTSRVGTGVLRPWRPAPPKRVVTADHRQRMRDSTRAKRARADRAAKLAERSSA